MPREGRTHYGNSLGSQGLLGLAHWTLKKGLPAITGLVVNQSERRPGNGFYKIFGQESHTPKWLYSQIQNSKDEGWNKHVPNLDQSNIKGFIKILNKIFDHHLH